MNVMLDFVQNGFLSKMGSPLKAERIVIVAIAIYVARVDLVDSFVKVYVEEATTCRFSVCLA